MDRTTTDPQGGDADTARLRAIRRYLSSFLPGERLEQMWQEGFASPRQPSFRINSLRVVDPARSSCAAALQDPTGAGACVPSHLPGCLAATEQDIVRQLLEGFGLGAETAVEAVPYFPRARVLPPHTAAAVHVASRVHSLAPLRTGAVYFMSLSSMLPALVLMAPQPPPSQTAFRAPISAATGAAGGRPPTSAAAATTAAAGGSRSNDGFGAGMYSSAVGPAAAPAEASYGGGGTGGGGGGGGGGLRVLDLCAAPGGKTALLAELMGNRGTLLAVDASWPRLQRLQFNLERLIPDHPQHPHRHPGQGRDMEAGERSAPGHHGSWCRGCVVAVHADGRSLRVDEHGLPLNADSAAAAARRRRRSGGGGGGSDARLLRGSPAGAFGRDGEEGETGVYDRVLVDAPCSSLGRLQLHRPDSYREWEAVHARRNAVRQRELLLRAARLLRRGGSLVYSTCTIDPQENEAVIAWLLGRVPGLRLVEPRLPAFPAIASPCGRTQTTASPTTASPTTFSPTTTTIAGAGAGASTHPPQPLPSTDSRGASSDPAMVSPTVADVDVTHNYGYVDGYGHGYRYGYERAVAPTTTTLLRDALEAHRPGCTYPALVDGLAWECVAAAAADGAADAGAPGMNLSAAGVRGRQRLASFGGGGGGAYGGGDGAAVARLRDQLVACCVRVAPGLAYEGFFLAQLVKL